MAVIVTLDYFDGSKSKSTKPIDLEEAMRLMYELKWELMQSNCSGITISKVIPLGRHDDPKYGLSDDA